MQKYLGIQIDSTLDWSTHISSMVSRGYSKLSYLHRNLKGCPSKLRGTAYFSLVRPSLEYCCSVVVVGYPLLPADWGESNAPPLFGPFHAVLPGDQQSRHSNGIRRWHVTIMPIIVNYNQVKYKKAESEAVRHFY